MYRQADSRSVQPYRVQCSTVLTSDRQYCIIVSIALGPLASRWRTDALSGEPVTER